MRILFLTNFYLTGEAGGEEQSCKQVVEGLQQRGHATLVLTSMHRARNAQTTPAGVCRTLHLEMDLAPWRNGLTFFTSRRAKEKQNLQRLEYALEKFAPDIIFIWGMWNLPKSLPALAEARRPNRVVYRFATYWPTLPSQYEFYWRAAGRRWYSRLPKLALSRIALALLARENRQCPPLTFKHAICVSAATREALVAAGIPVANARVIHTGLDAARYSPGQHARALGRDAQNLNLLYAGRLAPEKGVDTAIVALEKLVLQAGWRSIRLSVAGSDVAGYEARLRQMVGQAGLEDYVSFVGVVPADEMPRFLRNFDVLLVPSIWPEPFSRVMLEGLLAGLVVVASRAGGATEILVDGENGLLFAPGDSGVLAQTIARLAADAGLRDALARAGRQTAVERFTSTHMLDQIECFLQEVAAGAAREDTIR